MGTATIGRVLGGRGGAGVGGRERVVLDASAGYNLSKLVPTQEGAYTCTYTTTTTTTTTVDAVVLHWRCHHHHSFTAEVMIIID